MQIQIKFKKKQVKSEYRIRVKISDKSDKISDDEQPMDTQVFTTSQRKAIRTIRGSSFYYSLEADVKFLFLRKIEKLKMEKKNSISQII